MKDKANDTDHLIFTGHSLGGAMATLAMTFIAAYKEEIWPENHHNVTLTLITYAGPKVGCANFKKYFDMLMPPNRFKRVIVEGDPVPRSPPTLIPVIASLSWFTKMITGMFGHGINIPATASGYRAATKVGLVVVVLVFVHNLKKL